MLTCGLHVIAYQPVSGYDPVEPYQTPFVRMAAVTVFFEYLLNLWWRVPLRHCGAGWNAGSHQLQ
jgi:hypothetical protein